MRKERQASESSSRMLPVEQKITTSKPPNQKEMLPVTQKIMQAMGTAYGTLVEIGQEGRTFFFKDAPVSRVDQL